MKRSFITGTEVFLALLALILIGISFYQTWIGLDQIFGPASMPISFVLSALLLFLCWQLRNAKIKQQPTGSLLAIYCFVALFCFMANFNALYTRFMRTDIYATELRNINASFAKLNTDVASKLSYKYTPEIAQEVETKKKQLMSQIQDPGNPGIGDRALNLIADLEKLLKAKVDIYQPLRGDYNGLAQRMGTQIDQMLLDLSPKEAELKENILKQELQYSTEIEKALALSNEEINKNSQMLINRATVNYNKLGEEAQGVLGESKFKFEPYKSNTQEIGKVGYAFSHAITNFGVYQLIVLMGCLLLDFMIPIIILLVTKPDQNNSSNSVIGTKRKGGVLIPSNY